METSENRVVSLIFLPGLLIILLFSGCNNEIPTVEQVTPSQITRSFSISTPSIPVSLTPIPSWTPIPPTPTQLPPLPTLPPDQAQALVLELLETNGGCKLPCWWGFTPGESTWDSTSQFLSTFANYVTFLGFGDSGYEGYEIGYGIVEVPFYNSAFFVVENNIVLSIDLAQHDKVGRFPLHQLLTQNGRPAAIIVYVLEHFLEPNQGSFPFELALYYPDQHIIAAYFFDGQKRNDVIFWCAPQEVIPELFLWAPDVPVDVDAIVSTMIGFASGFDTEVSQRHLEDFTNMNIDEFYQAFVDPNSTACLESPVDLWE